MDNLHPYPVEETGSDYRQAIHYVLLDKDERCPTADLSNTGRPNGPAYSTGELFEHALGVWLRPNEGRSAPKYGRRICGTYIVTEHEL